MNILPVPAVLECMHFVTSSLTEQSRRVKHYELDLYLSGSREITLDGVSYAVGEGSLVFRRPGQFTVGKGDYNMYLLTVDFSDTASPGQKLYRSVAGPWQPPCDFAELDTIPPVFLPDHFEELKRLFEELSQCSYPGVEVDPARQREYMKELLLLVLYDAQKHNRLCREREKEKTDYVRRACQYIIGHFFEPLTVRDLAAGMNLNENYLIRLFKKELGMTPNRYILETRLLRARYLLLQTHHSVKEIAFSCGFATPSYFTKKFQERFGVLPLALRKQQEPSEKQEEPAARSNRLRSV